jgi:hypothetical protein
VTVETRFVRSEGLPALADELAGRLGCSREQGANVVAAADELNERAERLRQRGTERLRELNWLDVELYEDCGSAQSAVRGR